MGGDGRRTQIMLTASMRMLGTIWTISSSATNSTCSTDRTGPKNWVASHFTSHSPLPVECGREGVGYLGGREDGEVRVGLPRHECPPPNTRTWLASGIGSEREMEALRVGGGKARASRDRRILRPCLVELEIQKVFKIFRHIESCGTCIKH